MNTGYHKFIYVSLLLISGSLNALKINPWGETTKKETISLNKKVDKQCEISIHNISGSISITASTRDKIILEATKIGSKKSLESTQVTMNLNGNKVDIKTIQTIKEPNTKECEVSYIIAIPKTARLASVDTFAGSITITDSQGAVATTRKGTIDVKNSTGPIEVSTETGSITISCPHLISGQQVTAVTGKGDITMTVPQQTVASIEARTKNGFVSSKLPVCTKPQPFKEYNKKTVAKLSQTMSGTFGDRFSEEPELPMVNLITDSGNIKVIKV